MPITPPRTFARPRVMAPPPSGFSSRIVLALGAVTLATTLWGGAATWYILFHDEFAQTFLARQAEMRFAYEDRVSELKNRLEREITAGLVERKGFGARVDAVSQRQSEIEARQAWLSGLAERVGSNQGIQRSSAASEPTTHSSILPVQTFPSAQRTDPPPVPTMNAKPTPLPVEPFDLRLRSPEEAAATRASERLSAIEDSLRQVAEVAVASTDALRRGTRDRAFLIRQAVAATRVALPAAPVREKASGGPFVPAPAALDAAAFAPLAADAEEVVTDLERISLIARALPTGRPLLGDLEPTSGFGYRIDPFNRSAALHSGVDFRASHGAPVRATAGGRVTAAEYTGGYGNMVEIEHDGGVSTRYGHLSAISVSPGQRINIGHVVGRAGSTGRSTGTHLHYETRIDGEAVNPLRFLEAGHLLATAGQ